MSIAVVVFIVVCNMSSFRASKVLVSLFALQLGASQFYLGLMIAMYSVFPALLAIHAGRLSDRFGVRLPMLTGSLGLAAGLLLPGFWPGLPALYVSAAMIGLSMMTYNIATQNLVGALGAPEERTRNFSNYSLAMALGGFFGPLTAGFGIDHLGYASSYLCVAAIPLVPALIMARARDTGRGRRAKAQEEQAILKTNLLGNPVLRRTLMGSAIAVTAQDLFEFYMPIYGHAQNLPAALIGTVLSMTGIAAFFVRMWLPGFVRRWGPDTVFTTSLYVGAAAFLLVPLFTSAVALSAVALMLGLSLGCAQPVTLMLIFNRAPEGRSGEALGIRVTINQMIHIVVPVVFGSLGSLFGIAPVFVINSMILTSGGWMNRKSSGSRKPEATSGKQ
jgi:MFS family permease